MNIDWNKYFDHIYVYTCTKNFDKRKYIDEEFKRIGLTDYQYYYSPIDNKLINYEHFYNTALRRHINTTVGEYTLIKTCYELGYENILLCEDDIRFLKDINEIQNQLDIFQQSKNECNFYMFDYVWFNEGIFNFSCVYLDRVAMKYIIYCCENFPLVIDNYILPMFCKKNKYIEASWNYYNGIMTNHIFISHEAKVLPINVILAKKRLCIQEDYEVSYLSKQENNEYALKNINEYNI